MSGAPKQLSKRVQRRMTCAYMINDLGEDPASAAHKVGFDRTSTALKWAKQMEEHGHCLDNGTRESANPRGPKPSWTEENVHKLHSALHADPTGTGAGRIASTLAKEDDTFPKLHGTTWARALKLCGYSCQKSTMKYKIDPEQRLRFCNSSRDLSLSSNGMFTDSKMFPMGGSYKPGKPMMQWAPNGQPRERDGAKATHRVHAYGGVTAHGATKLYFASGTTGMKDNYKSPTKKVKKAAPANASRKRSRAQADEEGKPLSGSPSLGSVPKNGGTSFKGRPSLPAPGRACCRRPSPSSPASARRRRGPSSATAPRARASRRAAWPSRGPRIALSSKPSHQSSSRGGPPTHLTSRPSRTFSRGWSGSCGPTPSSSGTTLSRSRWRSAPRGPR